MSIQKINKKYISEDEEDSDLIINNNDDFWSNEKKINTYNLEINNKYKNNYKEISYDIPEPQTNSNQNNFNYIPNQNNTKSPKIYQNNKIENISNNGINNINVYNSNNNNCMSTYNDEKTIFSKIAEDLYVDNMENNIKSKKSIFDVSKGKEDNYNKLTVENYLYTCADKENSKNNKIINDFIERKAKEQKFKKIGLEFEKFGKISQFDNFKRLSTDHKKMRRSKNARTPEQFLDDQKIMEEKHKNYINNLIKMHNDEINLCIKDRPTITKQSIKLANMNKNHNKNIHIKLYEEFYDKKKKLDEMIKNNSILENYNINLNGNKKIDNEKILENAERLYKDYKKKKNIINENKINRLKNIKNLSTISLINKNSKNIIHKKMINAYKTEFNSIFNKNISDNIQINFQDYLLFIYKLGLTDKNYNKIINENKNNLILNNFENNYSNNIKSKKNNLFSDRRKSYEDKNILTSININKKSTNIKSISNDKKKYEYNIEFKLAKDSWKIITKNKKFNEESTGSSFNILLFFLCLCGICKGEIDDSFFEKEFSFLLKEKENLIDINKANKIYNYFSILRESAMKNINKKYKTIKKDLQTKDINNKNNLVQNSKSFIKSINYNKIINNKRLLYSNNNKSYKSYKILNNNNLNIITPISNHKQKIENNKKTVKKYLIDRSKILSNSKYYTCKDNNIDNLNKIINPKKDETKTIKSNPKINKTKIIYKTDIKKGNNNNKNKKELDNIYQKEKNSSITNYIFNEDYRIKDDIESNSNINNYNEENKYNVKNNNSENYNDYNLYNESNINSSNINNNKNSLMINDKISNNNIVNNYGKKKKNKLIFKIIIKEDVIKLEINKDDNIELKINEFCKENNIEEEDKEQILEVVNCKLNE